MIFRILFEIIDKYKMSKKSIVKELEGLRLKPYLCQAGKPTIGYGNTYYEDGRKVTLNDPPITEARADELFENIHNRFKAQVLEVVKTELNYNQLEAITSLTYNIGIGRLKTSTILKKININPNDPTIANEFPKWKYAKGEVSNGLIARRKKEAELYFS